MRLTAIDSQARSGMFNPNAIVCDFPLPPYLVPFFPAWSFAREIKSSRYNKGRANWESIVVLLRADRAVYRPYAEQEVDDA